MEINQLFDHHAAGFLSQLLIYGRLETVQFALNSLPAAQRQGLQSGLTRTAAFLGCTEALQA